MFRHLAILKFKPDASEEARKRFVDNFPNMAKTVPQIKSWSIGRDAGLGGEPHVKAGGFPPNYDVGLQLDFDNTDAYRQYAESPVHQKFFAEYVGPILAERVVVQFHL
jgi:hypothetical protein